MRSAFGGLAALSLLTVRIAFAQDAEARRKNETDHFELTAHSETYAALFRRALLPGPQGSIVSTETVVPINQYVLVSARDVDTAWRTDSIDFEVSAWGRLWPTDTQFERPLDGDIQTAYVSYRHEPLLVRLGRQQVVGGAARFSRFDGLLLGADIGAGFSAQAYGGFSVLPRWNARPGYHHLGSAADSWLRDENALPDPERAGYWMAGGRVGFASQAISVHGSFHEQREHGDIARRNLGLDARGSIAERAVYGGSAIMDLDSTRLADTRLWVDVTLAKPLQVSVEYLHTEPALWLSRQSVLSVFSTDRFDEAGVLGKFVASRRLSLEGGGFIAIYDDSRPGGRAETTLRMHPDLRTLIRLSYVRVLAPSNGYHSLRSSLSRRVLTRTSATFEIYAYLYDEAISSHRTSTVYAGTLSYQAMKALNLLWGGSLASTPYAALDAQALLRVTYDLDASERGGVQ